MSYIRPILSTLLISSALLLTACENAEERAEEKYQSAVSLIDDGKIEQALVELRGVFDLNGEHQDARMLYAQILRDKGDFREAYSHYLLSAEQYPSAIEPRLALAEMAMRFSEWNELDRHLEAARFIEPENLRLQAMELAMEYRDTMRGISETDLDDINRRAKDLLAQDPALVVARNLLVDTLVQLNDPYGALEELDKAIAQTPNDVALQEFRLRLLNQINDPEEIGAQLRTMVEIFPENDQYKLFLVQWYVSQGDIASAEEFLRAEIERAPENDRDTRSALVQFRLQLNGPDAALELLDEFIAETDDPGYYEMLRASTIYDRGEREQGITEMRAILEGREASDETRNMQVTLARMLIGTGEIGEAVVFVDEVLEGDPRHVGALKIHSDMLIIEDRVGDAILALRTALDQAPLDPDLRTLLAKAHERDGNRELMGENLALAVQASRAGEAESLRYAKFLQSQDKYASARDVILQSLRANPNSLELLRALSDIYIELAEWQRASQVAQTLRGLGTETATLLANGIEATVLQRMERTDESLELLRGMMEDDSTALVAQAAIIRTHLANDELEAARDFLDKLLAENPDSAGLKFLNGALLSVEGDLDSAAAIYKDLAEKEPKSEAIWRAYITSLARAGREEEALAALETALENIPDAPNLLWFEASYAEKRGDMDRAIEIYENLYARQSSSTIVANNLASLLTTHRDDDETLQRAYVIARRLKGTEVPAFQDTYGWIAYRLGNYEEALGYLQAAAAGLPLDPQVQEHYGRVLLATKSYDDARAQFTKALALLPEDATERRERLEKAIAGIDAGN